MRDFLARTGATRESLLTTALTLSELAVLLQDTPQPHLPPSSCLQAAAPSPSPPPSPPSPEAAEPGVDPPVKRQLAPNIPQALTWFFLSCPTAEHIKTYLDTILILSTLMLGFAVGFLVSFESEALADADARWLAWCTNSTTRSLPRMAEWCGSVDASQEASETAFLTWEERPSYVLGQRAILTYGLLAMSLAIAVVQYLFMLGAQLDHCPEHERAMWWRLYQWPCHLAMGLFVAGTFFLVYTSGVVVRILFVADIDMMLGGRGGGLWHLVQVVGWVAAGLTLGLVGVNLGEHASQSQSARSCTHARARPRCSRWPSSRHTRVSP